MDRYYYVYIMTNWSNEILYIGFTSNLLRRVYEHKNKLADGFTKKYNLSKLVYYEVGEDYDGVLSREKQLKKWSRKKKISIIEIENSVWDDLSVELDG